jgi:hypothetical protein
MPSPQNTHTFLGSDYQVLLWGEVGSLSGQLSTKDSEELGSKYFSMKDPL